VTEAPAKGLAPHIEQFLKEKRLADQKRHGERVEERQRVNGKTSES